MNDKIWTILAIPALLLIGALYGYWIGTLGKRNSWPARKVVLLSYNPFLVIWIVLFIARDFGLHLDKWLILAAMAAAVPSLLVAARRAGIPFKSAFFSHPPAVTGKNDLSIR